MRPAASPAPGWSRSRTTTCRASIMRITSARWSRSGSGRVRPAASANSACRSPMSPPRSCASGSAAARSISTSSIIPANGCSTCRCSARTSPPGRKAGGARPPARKAPAAAAFLARADAIDHRAPPRTRPSRARLAALFTAYLRACRADEHALSTLPPGRFLMPGDLDGLAGADLLPPARPGRRGAVGDRWPA